MCALITTSQDHVFTFAPSLTQKIKLAYDLPDFVQGKFTINPDDDPPLWIHATPGIPSECDKKNKFVVQWDIVVSTGVNVCVGVQDANDKRWYFTDAKSGTAELSTDTPSFNNVFKSGDTVRVILERDPQENQCTMHLRNLTEQDRKAATAATATQNSEDITLNFVCPDPLFPVVCIRDPSQSYAIKSVHATDENDSFTKTTKLFKPMPIKAEQSIWKQSWDQIMSMFKRGGKTRKRRNKRGTRRKFKRANMKTRNRHHTRKKSTHE